MRPLDPALADLVVVGEQRDRAALADAAAVVAEVRAQLVLARPARVLSERDDVES